MTPGGYDDFQRGKPVLPALYYAHRRCWARVLFVVRIMELAAFRRALVAGALAPLTDAMRQYVRVRDRDRRLFYTQWRRKARTA